MRNPSVSGYWSFFISVINISEIMGTEYKHADSNMDDSGNSCGSSVVSDYSGPSYADLDGVQISDIENDTDSHVLQTRYNTPTPCQIYIHGHFHQRRNRYFKK